MLHAPKFNPSFQTDAESIANFVVRTKEFDTVIDVLTSAARPPRILVEAPRGAGKTTLCRRVLAETRAGALAAKWIAIALGEESYAVTTPGEFFLECLFQLNDQRPDSVLAAAYTQALAATNDVDLLRRCMSALESYSRSKGRRLLIIVENFHVLLNEQIQKGVEDLISVLSDEALFGVLATSVMLGSLGPNEIHLPKGFLRVNLNPLTLEECRNLWLSLNPNIVVNPDKIRPLQILTGGSPRLLHILAEFMRTPSLKDLMSNLNYLIDQNTEYFKSQLDALPAMERKVFAALLDAWDPVPAKHIAEIARVDTNTASAMLSRLAGRGSVLKEMRGRTAIYAASERLFNIYYLMRRRTTPSSRVRALVAFMTQYYDRDELVATTATLTAEACTIDPGGREDYYSTFEAIISHTTADDALKILTKTPVDFVKSYLEDQRSRSHRIGPRQDEFQFTLLNQAEEAIDREEYSLAKEKLAEVLRLNPDSGEVWLRLCMLLMETGELAEAAGAARRATEFDPMDAWGYAMLGNVLFAAGDAGEAVVPLETALSLDSKNPAALGTLADVKAARGDELEALDLYARASKIKPFADPHLARYANLLIKVGQMESGLKLLRKSARDPDNTSSRRALLDALDEVGRANEAADFMSAVAEKTGAWQVWADLGAFLLWRTDRAHEARIAFAHVIAAGERHPLVMRMFARSILKDSGDREEPTKIAEELASDSSAVAKVEAGQLFATLGDKRRAEAAFRAALKLNDGSRARLFLARLLKDSPQNRPEAIGLLRDLIASMEGKAICGPSKELAEILIHAGQDTDALAVVDRATEANPACYCCLVLRGEICRRSGDTVKARESFQQAADLSENGVAALIGLASVSGDEDASVMVDRAIQAAPEDPRCLTARAKLSSTPTGQKMADARQALAHEPDYVEAHILLAALEAQAGHTDDSLGHFETALGTLSTQREWIPDFVNAVVRAGKLGMASDLNSLLSESSAGTELEPLKVALLLLQGETPLVAKEILDVANDILRAD